MRCNDEEKKSKKKSLVAWSFLSNFRNRKLTLRGLTSQLKRTASVHACKLTFVLEEPRVFVRLPVGGARPLLCHQFPAREAAVWEGVRVRV